MRIGRASGVVVLALVGPETVVCPRLLDWGPTREERRGALPG
jgi:hypothetical protein